MTKAAFKKRTLFTRKLGLSLRKKPANCYIRNVVFMVLKLGLLGAYTYVRNTWAVLKCDVGGVWRKLLGQIMRKNEEVLHRDNAERNILYTINRRTGNWIGDMFRDCLLKHVIEGKIEKTIRQEGRSKQLLDDVEETGGCWKLKERALDCALWSSRFGRVCGSDINP